MINKLKEITKKSGDNSPSYSRKRALEVSEQNRKKREEAFKEAKTSGIELPQDFREYGSFDRRLIACTIDLLILIIISIPLNKILELLLFGGQTSNDAMTNALQSIPDGGSKESIIAVLMEHGLLYKVIFLQFSSIILLWLYCTFSWIHMNATIGKYIMKLKIVLPKDKKMTFLRASLRFFSYALSAIVLFMGFFWMYFNKERRTWHDNIASTRVIHYNSSPLGVQKRKNRNHRFV